MIRVDLLQLTFEAAYLNSRQQAGMVLSAGEQERLALLTRVFLGNGRRSFRRVRLGGEACINQGAQNLPAKVLDISAGGCLLQTTEPPDRNSKLRLEIIAADGGRLIFSGEVLRTNDAGGEHYTFAVRFTAVPLELRGLRRVGTPPPVPFDAAG